MTSRINYNSPLKSVRTIRALKIDQCDPQTIFVDDPARLSDADLMKEAGIAFVWENAPGRSKVEQEKSDAAAGSPVELKPPPQQLLSLPPFSKVPSVDVPKSPPPAGTSPGAGANARPSYDLFATNLLPPPQPSADIPSPNSRSKSSANNQLPPKPSQSRAQPSITVHQQQSSDKPPAKPPRVASVSVPQSSGHHNSGTPLQRNGGYDQQSGHRSGRTRRQEIPVPKEYHHHSSLASTLHALTNDKGPALPHRDLDLRSLVAFTPDEGNGTTRHSDLNRGSQEYVADRLRQAPMQGVKDFYLSGRHSPTGTVPNSGQATLQNSCMPTRPNSASASEAGSSHSDDGDQTDAGDAFSNMNMNVKDFDARYQVSTFDGDQHDTSRHTDPRARDFIMERFLPAAKAMVTETVDVSDRRSSQEAPSVSPTRGKGRPSLPGRSRFAFKDQFAEEAEQQEGVEQSDMLFKCKFPWQMGALRSAAPQRSTPPDSGSVEQSPSASFGNRDSPSPSASFGNRNDSSPGPYLDDQHNAALAYAEFDGSATPKGDNSGSFEDRRLPPKSRKKNGSIIPGAESSRMIENDNRDSNRTLSFSGESVYGEHEGEFFSSSRAYFGVPQDRLDETATHGDCDAGNNSNGPPARSSEISFSGSLGTLLKTTQLQRRDIGKGSGVPIPQAGTNVQEPIPPSSILNHHRYNPSHGDQTSSAYGGTNSSAKPSYHGNGIHHDESKSYSRHLKVNLIRQQFAEPSGRSGDSGRSLESLNDEVWEAGRESIPGSKSPSFESVQGKMFTTSNFSTAQLAISDVNAVGWPLGKAHARIPSSESKDASFSSISDHSLQSPTNHQLPIQQEKSSSEKYSPVSVLQPPLPKSPAESWLFKVRPPVPPSTGSNWQGPKPKKLLEYSMTDDSMDVKWEVLVKSENVQLRHKLAQEVQGKGPGLEKSEILGSKAR